MSSIRVGEMIKRWRGNKRRSAIKLTRIRRPHTRARPSISTIVPPPPPSPPVSTRRPFVCIFKLNRLYAAIPQFYAASSCPHYRVKPVREIQSATISTTGEICNESPKQWRRQSKLAERGYYWISGDGTGEEGFVFRVRAYPLFKEGKNVQGGENRETNRENYIGIGSWIGMKTPRIVA